MAFRSAFTTFSGPECLAPWAQHPKLDPILSRLKPVHSSFSVFLFVLRKDLRRFSFYFF